MSVAGLICAIVGLPLCGVPALVGLVLSIVGLAQTRSRPDELKGGGVAVAGLVISLLAIIVWLVFVCIGVPMLAAGFMKGETVAQAVSEMDQQCLKQLGAAISSHVARNGEYPDSLEELAADGMVDPSMFVSPAVVRALFGEGDMANGEYRYVGSIPADVDAMAIVAYTPPGFLPGGRNVLTAGGAVYWLPQAPPGDSTDGLAASYASVVEAFGEELTAERDAELRRFYEIDG